MAKNFMSSILDELMGRDRDALPTETPKKINWDDPEMCTLYLVCFCPHELFVNTKADLGACVKFHDEQMRKKYLEEAPSYKRAAYETEFIRFAEKMISDIEGKIKRGRMRIALANGPDGGTYAGPGSKNAEKIALLTERINNLLEETEAAGCEGDVEKAQGLMKLCDQLREDREQLKSNEVSHPWNPDKAMQVCEVCGSYLIIGEAQHRLDDHIMGKQHVGFAMLRKNLEEVKAARDLREKEERERVQKERERRYGRTSRDNEGGRRRSRERGEGRSGSRHSSKSDKSEKERQSHRSRSQEQDKKERSRDEKEKGKKERDRDEKDKKDKDRSDRDEKDKKDKDRSDRDEKDKKDKDRSDRDEKDKKDKDRSDRDEKDKKDKDRSDRDEKDKKDKDRSDRDEKDRKDKDRSDRDRKEKSRDEKDKDKRSSRHRSKSVDKKDKHSDTDKPRDSKRHRDKDRERDRDHRRSKRSRSRSKERDRDSDRHHKRSRSEREENHEKQKQLIDETWDAEEQVQQPSEISTSSTPHVEYPQLPQRSPADDPQDINGQIEKSQTLDTLESAWSETKREESSPVHREVDDD